MTHQVEIYIDKITLEGFANMNTGILRQAIQEHLTSLIAEHGFECLRPGYGGPERVNAGTIHLGGGNNTGEAGRQIAGGIYRGIRSSFMQSQTNLSR